MADYFFIEREDMPCIYKLGFDKKNLTINIMVHKDFTQRHFVLDGVPIVEHFQNEFGFSDFAPRLDGQFFGFDNTFQKVTEDEEFVIFSVPIPVGKKVREIICPACLGQKRKLFNDPCRKCNDDGIVSKECEECRGAGKNKDDCDCLHCWGSGIETYFDWRAISAVSASFDVFFRLTFATRNKDWTTRSKLPQLILIDTSVAKDSCCIGGTYSTPLVKWLSRFNGGTELEEVSLAMRLVWEKIRGEINKYDAMETWARVDYENGWLNISCPGDRCSLYPCHTPQFGNGYEFSCHNVDNSAQLVTFLAGLGALCDRARKEIKSY